LTLSIIPHSFWFVNPFFDFLSLFLNFFFSTLQFIPTALFLFLNSQKNLFIFWGITGGE